MSVVICYMLSLVLSSFIPLSCQMCIMSTWKRNTCPMIQAACLRLKEKNVWSQAICWTQHFFLLFISCCRIAHFQDTSAAFDVIAMYSLTKLSISVLLLALLLFSLQFSGVPFPLLLSKMAASLLATIKDFYCFVLYISLLCRSRLWLQLWIATFCISISQLFL